MYSQLEHFVAAVRRAALAVTCVYLLLATAAYDSLQANARAEQSDSVYVSVPRRLSAPAALDRRRYLWMDGDTVVGSGENLQYNFEIVRVSLSTGRSDKLASLRSELLESASPNGRSILFR